MPIRLLALVLVLGVAGVSAAPPAKKAPIASQEIDVDALARAKDVDASKPADSSESGATEVPGSEQPVGDNAPAEPAFDPAPAPSTDAQEDPAAAPAEATTTEATPEAATPATTTEAAVPDSADKRHAQACDSRARKMLDAAQKGDFTAATKDFDARMRTALTPQKLKEAWDSLSQFGPLQARGQSHFSKIEGYVAVSVPLVFEKANLYAQVACNTKDQVSGFYVKPIETPVK